jgi:hypothetical protein
MRGTLLARMADPISLETYAAISAWLAEDRPLAAALEAHGVTDAQWSVGAAAWEQRVGHDGALAETYAAAFVRAQDALEPPRPMTPEAWARLMVDIGHEGIEGALAAQKLSAPDYARLARHFAREMGQNRATADRYAAAFCDATKPGVSRRA